MIAEVLANKLLVCAIFFLRNRSPSLSAYLELRRSPLHKGNSHMVPRAYMCCTSSCNQRSGCVLREIMRRLASLMVAQRVATITIVAICCAIYILAAFAIVCLDATMQLVIASSVITEGPSTQARSSERFCVVCGCLCNR